MPPRKKAVTTASNTNTAVAVLEKKKGKDKDKNKKISSWSILRFTDEELCISIPEYKGFLSLTPSDEGSGIQIDFDNGDCEDDDYDEDALGSLITICEEALTLTSNSSTLIDAFSRILDKVCVSEQSDHDENGNNEDKDFMDDEYEYEGDEDGDYYGGDGLGVSEDWMEESQLKQRLLAKVEALQREREEREAAAELQKEKEMKEKKCSTNSGINSSSSSSSSDINTNTDDTGTVLIETLGGMRTADMLSAHSATKRVKSIFTGASSSRILISDLLNLRRQSNKLGYEVEVCVCICTSVYMCVYVYVCMNICMYVIMHLFISSFMYVCMYVCTSIYNFSFHIFLSCVYL